MLSEIFFVDEILIDYKVSIFNKLKDILFLNSLNFNSEKKEVDKNKIKSENYEYIWIDNSLYGSIAKYIKKINSKIKIITFFQNNSSLKKEQIYPNSILDL
ncbi:MAG: hypothetical protein ACRC6E_14710 [Fusobacteriaceae bacterium]